MDAKELRIGNIVVDGKGRICRVTEIHGVESEYTNGFMAWPIDGGGITTTPHKAIELTEQWLLDFGFQYEEEHITFRGLTLNLSEWVQFYSDNQDDYTYVCLFVGLRDVDLDTSPQIHLYYVHQLQNLYFALTGEELTLKKDMDI